MTLFLPKSDYEEVKRHAGSRCNKLSGNHHSHYYSSKVCIIHVYLTISVETKVLNTPVTDTA